MKKLIYEKIIHHTFPDHTDTPITILINIYEHTHLFGLWKTYSYKITNTRLSWTYMDRIVSDTIKVSAGNLNVLLGDKKDLITNLTLKGKINGTDITTIRSMAKLTVLDMSKASIVKGGVFISSLYDDKIDDISIGFLRVGTPLASPKIKLNAIKS